MTLICSPARIFLFSHLNSKRNWIWAKAAIALFTVVKVLQVQNATWGIAWPKTMQARTDYKTDTKMAPIGGSNMVEEDAGVGGVGGEKIRGILRVDWTNVPPTTPLGKRFEESQSKCLDIDQDDKLQGVTIFDIVQAGMGSSLHTWSSVLCWAVENNSVLLTGSENWDWNDAEHCPSLTKIQQESLASDRRNVAVQESELEFPPFSTLWCYFGHHESGLRCPTGSINLTKIDRYNGLWELTCDQMVSEFGLSAIRAAAMEWLFQNLTTVVIEEAERQVLEEAFPNYTNQTGVGLLPPPDVLIAVHIRWGDKGNEMELVSVEEYINAVWHLLTEDERDGVRPVYIYLASEDPEAIEQFTTVATNDTLKWHVHTSGPTNLQSEDSMQTIAATSQGHAGLESIAALLISLQANRYVLTTGSNWSRLINELRKNVIDPRCGNCTQIMDLLEGEY